LLKVTHALGLEKTLKAAVSDSTLRCYKSAWNRYCEWVHSNDYENDILDPEIVSGYLSELAATRSGSTVSMAKSSILHFAGQNASVLASSPGLKLAMKGISRTQKGYLVKRARSLSRLELKKIATAISEDTPIRSAHNMAFVLLFLCLGCRASEIANLRLSDIHPIDENLSVTIRFSKTSLIPVDIPVVRSLPLDPVKSVKEWMTVLTSLGLDSDKERYLFRSIKKNGKTVSDGKNPLVVLSISRLLVRLVEAGDCDPTGVSSHTARSTYASHSLQSYGINDVNFGRWKIGSSTAFRYDRTSPFLHPSSGWIAG